MGQAPASTFTLSLHGATTSAPCAAAALAPSQLHPNALQAHNSTVLCRRNRPGRSHQTLFMRRTAGGLSLCLGKCPQSRSCFPSCAAPAWEILPLQKSLGKTAQTLGLVCPSWYFRPRTGEPSSSQEVGIISAGERVRQEALGPAVCVLLMSTGYREGNARPFKHREGWGSARHGCPGRHRHTSPTSTGHRRGRTSHNL